MRKSNKTDQQVATSVGMQSGVEPSAQTAKAVPNFLMSTDFVNAVTTDDEDSRKGKQLSLFADNYKLSLPNDVEVTQVGITFDIPSAYKLLGVLLEKLGNTIEINDGEAYQVGLPTAENADYPVRIGSRSYSQPYIEVTLYELTKAMFGTVSGHTVKDCRRALEEVQKTNHLFLWKKATGKDNNGKPVYDLTADYRSIIAVTYLDVTEEQVKAIEAAQDIKVDTNQPKGKMRILFHPVTIHSLGRFFTLIPTDLEEKLKTVGVGRSPYIRLLAYMVCAERGLPKTKRTGSFELGKDKLVNKLQLQEYRNRPKDLERMLNAAFTALRTIGLVSGVKKVSAKSGGDKYVITPTFEAESDLILIEQNGAA